MRTSSSSSSQPWMNGVAWAERGKRCEAGVGFGRWSHTRPADRRRDPRGTDASTGLVAAICCAPSSEGRGNFVRRFELDPHRREWRTAAAHPCGPLVDRTAAQHASPQRECRAGYHRHIEGVVISHGAEPDWVPQRRRHGVVEQATGAATLERRLPGGRRRRTFVIPVHQTRQDSPA